MNTLSNAAMSVELLSNDVTHHTLTPPKIYTRSTELKTAEGPVIDGKEGSSKPLFAARSRLRLGEAVRHSKFGSGQVLAHLPEGTLLIRFDNGAMNRPIWPSFLDRVNGQLR